MIFKRDARLLAFAVLASPAVFAADVTGVACQGRIIPESRIVNVAAHSETGVAVVAKLNVKEGDDVAAGAIIAETAALPAARARLAEAEAGVLAEKLAVKSARDAGSLAIGAARSELENARASLTDAKLGHARKQVSDEQVAELAAALAAKTAEIARLEECRPAFVLRADKAVAAARANADALSGDPHTAALAEVARADAARKLALKDYDTRVAGEKDALPVLEARLAHAKKLNALPQVSDAELAVAGTRVQAAEARVALETSRAEAEAGRAEAAVKIAVARVATLAASVESALVRAPLSGRILRVDTRAGETVSQTGVVEMADISKMAVIAEVSASDLPRVKTGMRAEIRVPGLDGTLSGKVVLVGSLIGANALVEEDPAAFRDLRVASVKIALDDPKAVSGLIRAQVTVRIVP